MKTIFSGNITIFEPTKEVKDWIEETLTLPNPVYANLLKRGQEETIKRKHVSEKIKSFSIKNGAYIVPFGLLNALWPCSNKASGNLI